MIKNVVPTATRHVLFHTTRFFPAMCAVHDQLQLHRAGRLKGLSIMLLYFAGL